MTFEKIKAYYDEGRWTKKMVHKAVALGYITAEQYQIITGEPYVPSAF